MKIMLIFLLFFLTKNSFANPYLSAGIMYQKSQDKFFYLQEKISPTLSGGYFTAFKNITASVQTNRISNFVQKEFVKSKQNGKAYELKSRLTADSLSIGYKFSKINPALVLSNVRLERNLGNRKINHAFIYSLNFNYFFNKNISISTAIVSPNKELGLTSAGLLSINYFF
jgi:hypothetical protein